MRTGQSQKVPGSILGNSKKEILVCNSGAAAATQLPGSLKCPKACAECPPYPSLLLSSQVQVATGMLRVSLTVGTQRWLRHPHDLSEGQKSRS